MVNNSPATFAELTNWPLLSAREGARPAADSVFRTIFTSLEETARVPRRAATRDAGAASDAAVMSRFESLGDNCEFGIVQKACRIDANGLFSFARTPPDVLVEVLRADFEGVSDPAAMRLAVRPTGAGSEYVLMNDCFGIVYHITGDAADGGAADIIRAETDRLHALEAAMRTKLARGDTIFVMKCNEDLSELEASDVLQELKRYGRNTLLYVVGATDTHPEGSVVRVKADLYRGHIAGFAPYRDAYDARTHGWVAICRNTLALHRGMSCVVA